ncbi:hypothetical protein AJ79_10054, partial [Helicocarpus griseus UAMH5409]
MVRQKVNQREVDQNGLSNLGPQALERQGYLTPLPAPLSNTTVSATNNHVAHSQSASQATHYQTTRVNYNGNPSASSPLKPSLTTPVEQFQVPYQHFSSPGPVSTSHENATRFTSSFNPRASFEQGSISGLDFLFEFPPTPLSDGHPGTIASTQSFESSVGAPNLNSIQSRTRYSGNNLGVAAQEAKQTIYTPNEVDCDSFPSGSPSSSSDSYVEDNEGGGQILWGADNALISQTFESVNILGTSHGSSTSDWELVEHPQKESETSKELPTPSSGEDSFRWVSCEPNQPSSRRRQQRRGPFQNQQLREETGNTRKTKACVRCRMQKIRCQTNETDPSGVCRTCQTLSKPKVRSLPCLRYKITESTLYRTGKGPGLEFTFRWPEMTLKDITDWASTEVRTIYVKSDVCPAPLKLSVRKFVPIPKDSLHKGWMDGKVKRFKKTTPYAIVNMASAAEAMRAYINAHVFECMNFFLQGRDKLIIETYSFAREHMLRMPEGNEKVLMQDFFRLWFAIRRTATTENIIGQDTLDMADEFTGSSYPLFGKAPLPPVMIQQLDMVLTLGILNPLRKKVLKDFQELVRANNPRSWLTMYLLTFMFLHSVAVLSKENFANARKHGLK